MIRVFLAASSPLLLAGLRTVIEGSGAATVVGSTTLVEMLDGDLDGVDADVVVVSVHDAGELPPLHSEPDAGARLPPIVLITDPPNADRAGVLFGRGVRALIRPGAGARELLAAVEAAALGLVVLPAEMAAEALTPALRPVAHRVEASPVVPLSPREQEILALLAEGMPNKLVASRLGISEHTVKTHVASILEKLGAETRAEAVAIGARRGLILL